MSMSKREERVQEEMWVPTRTLSEAPGHPFYTRLNKLLFEHGFDSYVEGLCARYYAETLGRPSMAPGVYFRMLMIGYFEGLDSERGIAWRVSDSLALRRFLGYSLSESPPDHSSLTRIRQRLPVEVHDAVFNWVLKVLAGHDLLKGKTVAVDATTLEANAAMRSIVRRDTGKAYPEYLQGLARAAGIEAPTKQDLVGLDKKRSNKASNKDWAHPHDADARITKMKDGRTHLAHKAEHTVDLDTEALCESLDPADRNLQAVGDTDDKKALREGVADKGYHSNHTMKTLKAAKVRSYVSEPDRGRRNWKKDAAAKAAVYANRRRIRGERGKRLQRQRAEVVERSFAHAYETGGMRRTHLRGHTNIYKRLCIHGGAFNLSLLMRQITGKGTPRALHGLLSALRTFVYRLKRAFRVSRTILPRLCALHPYLVI